MEELVYSEITKCYYAPTKVVRILNLKQVASYLSVGLKPLDIYASVDRKTEEPVLVFIFDRQSSKEAYDKWCKGEI